MRYRCRVSRHERNRLRYWKLVQPANHMEHPLYRNYQGAYRPGLRFCNRFERGSKILRVLKPNVRNDCDLGSRNNISTVPSTAHADLKYYDITVLLIEILESDGSDELKLARMILHRLSILLCTRC